MLQMFGILKLIMFFSKLIDFGIYIIDVHVSFLIELPIKCLMVAGDRTILK